MNKKEGSINNSFRKKYGENSGKKIIRKEFKKSIINYVNNHCYANKY